MNKVTIEIQAPIGTIDFILQLYEVLKIALLKKNIKSEAFIKQI
jgi:hypothetical protein